MAVGLSPVVVGPVSRVGTRESVDDLRDIAVVAARVQARRAAIARVTLGWASRAAVLGASRVIGHGSAFAFSRAQVNARVLAREELRHETANAVLARDHRV
jgi:hypothetical protein